MKLTPDSWGSEDLREYNPCHDPKDGRFATKGAGRCEDRFVQARKDIRQSAKEVRKGLHGQEVKDKLTGWAARRREARQIIGQYPWFIRPDIRRALKDERVTTIPIADMGTSTSPAERSIFFNPHEIITKGFGNKRGLVSVYRHEVGHVNPTPLGREARVAGLDLEKDISKDGAFEIGEEIRAWRNAIVASRGKVDWGTVKHGLQSHIQGRLMRDKIDSLVAQGRVKTFEIGAGRIGRKLDLTAQEAKKIDGQIASKAQRLYGRVERHLKRYAALVIRKTLRKNAANS